MSEYNKNIISDEKLRQLLQFNLLKGDLNNPNTMNMINTEANYVFGSSLFNVASIPSESQMIQKLSTLKSKAFHLKWLFASIISVSAGLGVYTFYQNSNNVPEMSKASIPVINLEDQPIENKIPESTLDTVSQLNEIGSSQASAIAVPSNNNNTNPFNPIQIIENPPFIAPHQFEHMPAMNYPITSVDDGFPSNGEFTSSNNTLNVDTLFKDIDNLEVMGLFCDVSIINGNSNEIGLKANIQSDEKRDQKGLRYKITYEKIGRTLRINVLQNSKGNMVLIRNAMSKFEGKMYFVVDPKTEVSVKNSSGDLYASGLSNNNCSLECNYGNIKVEQVSSNLQIQSRSGDITLKNITGKINCYSMYGNQSFENIDGSIDSKSSSGNTHLSGIKGNLNLNVQYGDITLNALKGNLDLQSSSGNVKIDEIKGDHAKIKSLYGNIDIKNCKATFNIESNSGDVNLQFIKGDIELLGLHGKQKLSDVTGSINSVSRSGDMVLSNCIGSINVESTYGNVSMNKCKGKMNVNVSSGNVSGVEMEVEQSMTINSVYGNIKVNLLNAVETLSFDIDAPSGSSQIQKENLNLKKDSGQLSHQGGDIKIKSYTRVGSQLFN
jgi:lia operon protein LiaG